VTTQTFTETLVVLHCHECRCAFGITQDHYNRARASSRVSFFCPNGHEAIFTKTREQELARKLQRETEEREWYEAQLTHTRDQLEATERSLRGHKAAKTRIKNRVAAGLCPCCRRSFQNLARHMQGLHPDYSTTETDRRSPGEDQHA